MLCAVSAIGGLEDEGVERWVVDLATVFFIDTAPNIIRYMETVGKKGSKHGRNVSKDDGSDKMCGLWKEGMGAMCSARPMEANVEAQGAVQ